ncbi:hypothetical protein CPB86DRAFT_877752 [Serendipita vermifera]|nr:hypothetical protein CPB86DRAFT_877752 [Serendipita vermifera]
MVKTATNPAVESTAAARSATERASQTNHAHDIQDAILEWEKVIQTIVDSGPSQDHADILVSYADSLLLRWNLTHQDDDIRAVVSNLESALEKLPPLSTKARYDLMIRLATVHKSWYQNSKDNPAALNDAIRYWEDAYGLSAILRRMKEAANEILPSLANACFVAFTDEISDIDSLNQALHYYQVAIVHIKPELQTQVRLELGKIYLELMYYSNEVENAQLAIDCFEVVLKQSGEKDKLIEASNGKSQAWWWKLISEGTHKPGKENEDFPFRVWTKSVATKYLDDGIAVGYHAISFKWMVLNTKEELGWYHLAWTLLQLKRQTPPLGFHPFYSSSCYRRYCEEERKSGAGFASLPPVLSSIEQRGFFALSTSPKEIYMIQRMYPSIWKTLTPTTHPSYLKANQWNSWKRNTIDFLVSWRRTFIQPFIKICGDHISITETEEELRAQLETRIERPRNFPLQEDSS